jgi:hypothetical protein
VLAGAVPLATHCPPGMKRLRRKSCGPAIHAPAGGTLAFSSTDVTDTLALAPAHITLTSHVFSLHNIWILGCARQLQAVAASWQGH